MRFGEPITSRSNARVKALRAAFSGKASEPGELVGIEGVRMVEEAIKSKSHLDTVVVREGSEALLDQSELHGLAAENWVLLKKDVFSSVVPTESPQGIAATLKIPIRLQREEHKDGGGLTLMVEDLQDPGNLGTLIRSAEAFGFEQVFVSAGTVNPWNPKVVRASAGSILRLPVRRVGIVAQAELFKSFGTHILAAVADVEGATAPPLARLLAPCALLIGNEGAGLSAAAREVADELVRIPSFVESLNAAVAGSVLMYEALRQNIQRELSQQAAAERAM